MPKSESVKCERGNERQIETIASFVVNLLALAVTATIDLLQLAPSEGTIDPGES